MRSVETTQDDRPIYLDICRYSVRSSLVYRKLMRDASSSSTCVRGDALSMCGPCDRGRRGDDGEAVTAHGDVSRRCDV
jgi:hypothetical protein